MQERDAASQATWWHNGSSLRACNVFGLCGEVRVWAPRLDVSVAARLWSLPRRVLTSALATPGVVLGIFHSAPLETKEPEAVKVRLDTFVADVIVPLDVISATNHAVRVTCENKGEQGKQGE